MDNKDIKKPLLSKTAPEVQGTGAQEKDGTTSGSNAPGGKGALGKGGKLASGGSKEGKGVWNFLKFTIPALFRQGFKIKALSIICLCLVLLNKLSNVVHPLILKYAVDEVSTGAFALWLLIAYGSTRFGTELIYNINQIVFA